jgi:hypothetical protein
VDVQSPQSKALAADIARLESGIRQLKVQYDMFFNGALKLPPRELHAEVEKTVKRYLNASIPSYAQRFHFQALVSRFNSLSELWARNLRSQEEGYRPAPARRRSEPGEAAEDLIARCRVRDPQGDDGAMRELYDRFLAARQERGAKKGPSFDKFVRGVAGHAERLRNSAGCDEIELRIVVEDDKVQLKARPGR